LTKTLPPPKINGGFPRKVRPGLVDSDVTPTPGAIGARPRRGWIPIAAGIVVAGLLALMYYGLTTERIQTGVVPRPNTPAPDFQLPTFDGKTIRLGDLRGQVVVVNFWASWCVPCRDEQPALEAVWQQYKGRGVTFVGIDIQDTPHDALGFMQQYGMSYPVVSDATGAVYINYGVVGMPETYVVGREGTIQQKIVGPVDPMQLVTTLQELVK
jgi:cytochrome c biogenesis protein CcmG, thiol:disulfide interchange protein DsbE